MTFQKWSVGLTLAQEFTPLRLYAGVNLEVCVCQRDEESCPSPAHACVCSSDLPGASGSPGSQVRAHAASVGAGLEAHLWLLGSDSYDFLLAAEKSKAKR